MSTMLNMNQTLVESTTCPQFRPQSRRRSRPGSPRWSMIAIALCFVALALPSQAADGEWQVHAGLWHVDPDLSAGDGTDATLDADEDVGLRLGISRQFSERWSWAVEIGSASTELGVSFPADGATVRLSDDLNMLPVTAGFNLHLRPGKEVDFFIGARLAYVHYSSLVLELDGLGRQGFDIDDDLGWGLLIGLDVPFGDKGWSLHAVTGHIDTAAEVVNRADGTKTDLELDPTYISLGLGYRF